MQIEPNNTQIDSLKEPVELCSYLNSVHLGASRCPWLVKLQFISAAAEPLPLSFFFSKIKAFMNSLLTQGFGFASVLTCSVGKEL